MSKNPLNLKLSVGILLRNCYMDALLSLYLCDQDECHVEEIAEVLNADYVKALFVQFEVYRDKLDDIGFDDDFLEHAGMGQYVLVEDRKLKPYMDRVERILLFRWSKEGEVTRKLDVNIERGLLLVDEDLPLADGEQYTIEVWKLK